MNYEIKTKKLFLRKQNSVPDKQTQSVKKRKDPIMKEIKIV